MTIERDKTRRAEAMPEHARGHGPITLGVDIGGTKLKAATVDARGALLREPAVTSTPKPAGPDAVLDAIDGLVRDLRPFDRISVGFPGIVRGPRVFTAPNLGTPAWLNFDLAAALSRAFGVPVRVLNDAAIQGLGVVKGPGLETVITLGTGVGCAVYRNRNWLLHLELGLDDFVGNAVLSALGPEAWNERLQQTVAQVTRLTACERLYVGGGNARKVAFALPPHVEIVSNNAGLTGGVRLWEPSFDALFDTAATSTPGGHELRRQP